MNTLVLEGIATRAQQEAHPYLYLPFDLPAGAGRIDVRLEHDAGNVIDLGLLDPRAGDFPSREGFRGWSGGARDRFFVTTDAATPGYLPGPMPTGRWRVMLGLYRLLPQGCRYRLELEFSEGSGEEAPAPVPAPSFAVPAGWYPADLQSHTHHSDAKGSLADLVQAARARGLRILAVTDHNTVSHHPFLAEASREELFLLPGEEVTTDAGHANVWGAEGWVDFRIARPDDVATVVREAHALGGVISINHPKPGGPEWRYEVPPGIDAVEAWQAPWPAGNDDSLAFYDRLLRAGRRPTQVGGSDRHQPGWPDPDPPELHVGSPTTWLWLRELSRSACLAALRSGHLFVSESPAGPRLELWLDDVAMGGALEPRGAELRARVRVALDAPAELRLVGRDGPLATVALERGGHERVVELAVADARPFVRAELRDPESGHVRALSNPVYLD